MKHTIAILVLCLLPILGFAQKEEKIKINFRSRGLFDATLSDYEPGGLKSYYRVEDFRVGFKAAYDRFEIRADIGLGGGKVAIKDFLVNYSFNNSILTVGSAYEPFSMDMLISTYDMRFNQSASTVLAMTQGRRLGITYHLHQPLFYFALGAYSDNDINKLGSNELKQAYAATTRLVYRPVMETDKLFHIGGALSVRSPEGEVNMGSCGVTSLLGQNLLSTQVTQSRLQVKSLAELLTYYRKWLFQTEYMRSDVYRSNDLPIYRAQGAYVQLCYLLKGNTYGYDSTYAIPTRPIDKGAIELAFRFNYTDLNNQESAIYGGRQSDLSLGVNYYFNPYLSVKLNSSYALVGEHCNPYYNKNLFLMQTRLQYIF